MRTTKEYKENVEKNIITEEMLGDALYSVNKRAKNYRDKERAYRNYFRENRYAYDVHNYVERFRDTKEAYYDMKDKLLSIVSPMAIHIEKDEVYDEKRFYLFYKVGKYSFHTPLSEDDANKYIDSGLQTIVIDRLITQGQAIDDLISLQFVKKLVELINTNNYIYTHK